jgi:hypothetical protein
MPGTSLYSGRPKAGLGWPGMTSQNLPPQVLIGNERLGGGLFPALRRLHKL